MKVVILAGGLGTRISEESHLKPKPMIEVGDAPILWHIMKYYSSYGFNEFIICCGYKGYVIKEYFADYYLHRSDVTFDFANNNEMIIHNNVAEPWKVTVVDTGLHTMTGGRLKRIQKYVGDQTFMMTYGDGVSDIDLDALLEFHRVHKKQQLLRLFNREVDLVFWILMTMRQYVNFRKRQRKMADGSMQDSWCWSRKSLTI